MHEYTYTYVPPYFIVCRTVHTIVADWSTNKVRNTRTRIRRFNCSERVSTDSSGSLAIRCGIGSTRSSCIRDEA
eukprot:scaffold68030_cov39-Prasinocladus_malaysianus.AAC.1